MKPKLSLNHPVMENSLKKNKQFNTLNVLHTTRTAGFK